MSSEPQPPAVDRFQTQWGSTLVKVVDDGSGWHEVRIVENRDGTFGFEEWRLVSEPFVGPQWAPVGRGRTFADTPEAAEREARASVDWLAGTSPTQG